MGTASAVFHAPDCCQSPVRYPPGIYYGVSRRVNVGFARELVREVLAQGPLRLVVVALQLILLLVFATPVAGGFSWSLEFGLVEETIERVMTTMTRASWNGAVIASTDTYELVEGNVYFPPSSVDMQYAKPSDTHTTCGWKGQASYYTIVVDGKENKDAAWFYPSPKPAANNIKDYVAFWKGVQVEKAAIIR